MTPPGLLLPESRAASEHVDMPPLRRHRNGAARREGVAMARRATHGDESGRSVVGQAFSLQTGFSRSLRRVLRG
jgi:hypothetical protein